MINFNRLPFNFYLNQSQRFIETSPTKDIKSEPFNLKIWRKKFPIDIPLNSNLNKVHCSNIGLYNPVTAHSAKQLINFIKQLINSFFSEIELKEWKITEINGCVGCFSIRLAYHFNHLIIIEINEQHVKMIENNLSIYNLFKGKNVRILNVDALNVLFDLKSDLIIYSPPFDIKSAKNEKMKIGLNNINIVHIINELSSRKLFKLFILLVPFNFDIQDFIINLKIQNFMINRLAKQYFIAIINL